MDQVLENGISVEGSAKTWQAKGPAAVLHDIEYHSCNRQSNSELILHISTSHSSKLQRPQAAINPPWSESIWWNLLHFILCNQIGKEVRPVHYIPYAVLSEPHINTIGISLVYSNYSLNKKENIRVILIVSQCSGTLDKIYAQGHPTHEKNRSSRCSESLFWEWGNRGPKDNGLGWRGKDVVGTWVTFLH